MTLNSFRRLLKSLDFKATVVKYQDREYWSWQSPTSHYCITEWRGWNNGNCHAFTLYRNGKGRGARPFHFFYNNESNSKLKGYGDMEPNEGFDSALDPEPVILRRLTVLGVRPNINGVYL